MNWSCRAADLFKIAAAQDSSSILACKVAGACYRIRPNRLLRRTPMPRINGGEMLVRALEREGIREIFALHGGHLDAIFKACLEHGVRVIDTRHEQAAAHMADGWARTTGRPGVAMVTAGPGVTDAVTGVANAYLDAIPMILLGGRSPLLDDETLPLQGGIDQVALMRPITKWARSVT